MNPIPQAVKPILDIYSNKDSFTGRPIETAGMEHLKPDYRFTASSSMLARAASTTGQAVTGMAGVDFLSPVQIDHMLRGYFGWLGSFIVGASDMLARPATGQPTRPTPDYWKLASQGFISSLPEEQSAYVSRMYEQAGQIEQTFGTYRQLLKEGKTAEANDFFKANREDIARYKQVEGIKRGESRLNERIRAVERSALDPDEKRKRIAALQQQRDRMARAMR
jgi:hypothetical protein